MQAAERLLQEAIYEVQCVEEAEDADGVARSIFSLAWTKGEVSSHTRWSARVCLPFQSCIQAHQDGALVSFPMYSYPGFHAETTYVI